MDSAPVVSHTLRDHAAIAASLGDLKRIRDARSADSLATRAFRLAWARIDQADDVGDVALDTTADALAATLLGAIDARMMAECGVSDGGVVLHRAFDGAYNGLDPEFGQVLSPHLGRQQSGGAVPAFADALVAQPRAGATCIGKPRLILEPSENHGEHCLVVAVLGVLLSPYFGADPAVVFSAGLAHHLHNAVLPDSGFAGEMLLGAELEPLMVRLFDRTLATLQPCVATVIRASLATIGDADTPEGRAFHAADVMDRVLQMRHYDEVARFTTRQALDDLELVHAGPIQAFHRSVLAEAGIA